jgi:hypothetical protein
LEVGAGCIRRLASLGECRLKLLLLGGSPVLEDGVEIDQRFLRGGAKFVELIGKGPHPFAERLAGLPARLGREQQAQPSADQPAEDKAVAKGVTALLLDFSIDGLLLSHRFALL